MSSTSCDQEGCGLHIASYASSEALPPTLPLSHCATASLRCRCQRSVRTARGRGQAPPLHCVTASLRQRPAASELTSHFSLPTDRDLTGVNRGMGSRGFLQRRGGKPPGGPTSDPQHITSPSGRGQAPPLHSLIASLRHCAALRPQARGATFVQPRERRRRRHKSVRDRLSARPE